MKLTSSPLKRLDAFTSALKHTCSSSDRSNLNRETSGAQCSLVNGPFFGVKLKPAIISSFSSLSSLSSSIRSGTDNTILLAAEVPVYSRIRVPNLEHIRSTPLPRLQPKPEGPFVP